MMDVLWGDLHMTRQGRSSKSGDFFDLPFRTAKTQKILAGRLRDPSKRLRCGRFCTSIEPWIYTPYTGFSSRTFARRG